ncbi:MAG: AAA family ATPase [Cyanobacteria bacterium J06634_5]
MVETLLPPAGEPEGDAELGYGQLLNILWRRIYWLGGALVGSLALAVVATSRQAPTYESSMQLLVEPNLVQKFNINAEGSQTTSFSKQDYVTQLNLMRSKQFFAQAVSFIEQTSPDFCQSAGTKESCINRFQNSLKLFQLEEDETNTRIFEATFEGEDPEMTQQSLEALKETYLAYNLQQQDQRLDNGLELVNRQIDDVRGNLSRSQRALQQFRQNENLISPQEQSLSAANALEQLIQEQRGLQAQYQETQAQFDALQQVLALDPKSALLASRFSQSGRYQRLLNELQTSEIALSQRLAVHTEEDPVAQDLMDQRDRQLDLLRQETQRLLTQSAIEQTGSQATLSDASSFDLSALGATAEETVPPASENNAASENNNSNRSFEPLSLPTDTFAEAIRIAEQAGIEGQTASTVAEWQDLEARWQQASELMAQVPEEHVNYSRARDRITSYASNSQAANQKATTLQAQETRPSETTSGEPAETGTDLFSNGQLGEIDLDLVETLVTTQISLSSLEARQESLARSEQALRKKLNRFPRLIAEYDRLQPEVETQRDSLERLLESRQKLSNDIAQGGFNWQVVEPPNRGRKTGPNPQQNLMTGAIAGLFLGGLLAYGREAIDTVIRTPADLKKYSALPLLGALPKVSGAFPTVMPFTRPLQRKVIESSAILSLVQWQPFREAVDLIYKNIQLAASPMKSVMVTSAITGEGKTTLAVGLALGAARSQKRVLLVDADLRHPTLHNQLGLSNKRGLTMLLASVETPNPVTVSLAGAQIDILTAGPLSEDPVQLLNSHRMKELVAKFERQYDLIVFDTSAVLGRVDALQIASLCSGVVMVSKIDRVTQGDLTQAAAILARVNQLGIVANGSRPPTPTYSKLSSETVPEASLENTSEDFEEPLVIPK